jgi:phage terminase large subunit GpA-like protein
MLQNGFWKATSKPTDDSYYSYHISALYAPAGMFGWYHYANQFASCFPSEGMTDRNKLQAFTNLVLGQTFEDNKKETVVTDIIRNTRDYLPGVIPSLLSKSDGNGDIVLVTCAVDINGLEDDCRLDYEILAHSESGASYSVDQGSLGTFQRRKSKEDRQTYSLYHDLSNSAWSLLDEVINKSYFADDGREMKVMITGLDTGNFSLFAYEYIDRNKSKVVGIKGNDDMKVRKMDVDTGYFKVGNERSDLFLIQGNKIKDEVSDCMKLKWNRQYSQPPGFMNYPSPHDGKYTVDGYFIEYEGEHRKPELNSDGTMTGYRWVKKTNTARNHFWDCRVYNIALRHIFVKVLFDNIGVKGKAQWKDYIDLVK